MYRHTGFQNLDEIGQTHLSSTSNSKTVCSEGVDGKDAVYASRQRGPPSGTSHSFSQAPGMLAVGGSHLSLSLSLSLCQQKGAALPNGIQPTPVTGQLEGSNTWLFLAHFEQLCWATLAPEFPWGSYPHSASSPGHFGCPPSVLHWWWYSWKTLQ